MTLLNVLTSKAIRVPLGLRRHLARGFSDSSSKADVAVKGIPYKDLSIGVVKEIFPNERRVAMSPAVIILSIL